MVQLVKSLIVLSVTLFIHTSPNKALRQIELHGIKTRWSPHYFSNFTTELQNNTLSLDMKSIKNIENGYRAHIDFQIRLKGSKQYQTLFAYTLDICSVMITIKDTMFKRWFRSFFKYGNFMQNCPIYIGHYYMNGWKLEADMVPAYLYAGDYRVKSYGYFGKYRSKEEEFVMAMDLDVSLVT